MRAGRAGWRALGWFWLIVIVGLAGGAVVLQRLGPPQRNEAMVPTKPTAAAPVQAEATAPPPNGSAPMRAYARPFDAGDPRPRIALLLDGIGLSAADSKSAIETLPGAVTFAVSAYAPDPAPLLQQVRAHGHEYLASLPMEPQGYPLNDAGADELLSGATPQENQAKLDRVLGRISGYAGVTSASDGLRGERYAAMPELMADLAQTLVTRGLLYVDARPGKQPPSGVPARAVDLVIDQQPDQMDIDARLAALEQIAHDHGSALGLAGPPRPVTVARIAAWAATLERRGFVLAPVSAVIHVDVGQKARQDAAK